MQRGGIGNCSKIIPICVHTFSMERSVADKTYVGESHAEWSVAYNKTFSYLFQLNSQFLDNPSELLSNKDHFLDFLTEMVESIFRSTESCPR